MTIEGERILLMGQDIKRAPMNPRKVKTLAGAMVTVYRFSMKQRSHAEIERENSCCDDRKKPIPRYVKDAALKVGTSIGGNQAALRGWSLDPMAPIKRGGPAQKTHPGHWTTAEPAALVVEQREFPALEEMVLVRASLEEGFSAIALQEQEVWGQRPQIR